MRRHLNDEEFADVLSGLGSQAARDHLNQCEPCRLETARVSAAMQEFASESLVWAKSVAEQSPMPRIPVDMRSRIGHVPPLLRLAATLLAVCGLAGGAYHVTHEGKASRPAAAQGTAKDAIAADNKLMLAIEQEVDLQDASPSDTYSMTNNKTSGTKAEQE